MQRLHAITSFAALAAFFLLTGDSRAEDTGPPPESTIYFITPAPDLYIPDAPAMLTAEVAISDGTNDDIATVELFVDDVSIAIQPCVSGCMFADIPLEMGVHAFLAVADTGTSDLRYVYVGEEPPPPADTGEEGDSVSGDGDGLVDDDTADGETSNDAGSDDDSAKGCSVVGASAPSALLALPIMLLGLRLRRRD